MLIRAILNKVRKILYIGLGLICLVLGIIGYVMPGMPGTIWLIIAATLFIRSSDRLYLLVVNNRFFGPQVKEFLETGVMPLKAKTISIASIWVFSLISVVLAPYNWIFKLAILFLAVSGTTYILTRPTKGNPNH